MDELNKSKVMTQFISGRLEATIGDLKVKKLILQLKINTLKKFKGGSGGSFIPKLFIIKKVEYADLKDPTIVIKLTYSLYM